MPHKTTSKAQFRLFKAVEAGDVKLPGLPAHKAAEMTAGQSQAGLPERRQQTASKHNRGHSRGHSRRFRVG